MRTKSSLADFSFVRDRARIRRDALQGTAAGIGLMSEQVILHFGGAKARTGLGCRPRPDGDGGHSTRHGIDRLYRRGGVRRELRHWSQSRKSSPYDQRNRSDAGSGRQGIPGCVLQRADPPPRRKHGGFRTKPRRDARAQIRTDIAPQGIANQMVGVPRMPQSDIALEPIEVQLRAR